MPLLRKRIFPDERLLPRGIRILLNIFEWTGMIDNFFWGGFYCLSCLPSTEMSQKCHKMTHALTREIPFIISRWRIQIQSRTPRKRTSSPDCIELVSKTRLGFRARRGTVKKRSIHGGRNRFAIPPHAGPWVFSLFLRGFIVLSECYSRAEASARYSVLVKIKDNADLDRRNTPSILSPAVAG
jgi:hypothetical protein